MNMKNYFRILGLLLLFSNTSSAQEISIGIEEKVLNDYELGDKAFSSWKSIQNNWLVTDYEAIQMENKIKLNCKSCSAFYIEVEIKINANGKLEYYKLISGKRCGVGITKELEARMMRKFYKFEYPFDLRNTTFKTRLGTALKC